MATTSAQSFDKDNLVNSLATEWDQLIELCSQLDDAEWDLQTECPGWSVKDNLSHIIGTELTMSGQAAPDIEPQSTDHVKNAMGEANEKWIEARRDRSGPEVLAEFREVAASRIETLGAMSQSEFDAEAWTPAGPSTFGRMMRIRLFDSWMHDQDIRQATGRSGNLSGPHVDPALGEIVDSMGYVVGKLGGAPDGARVQIDLTGTTSLTIRVEIDGRAKVVEELSAQPTIGITMPTLLFTRLCGGRQAAGGALESGEIQLSGDRDAAERIATNLGYMI